MTGTVPVRTIPALVRDVAARWPHDEALVDDHERLTYATLARQVEQVAAGLVALGLPPGARVAIWAPNSIRWVLAALGTWAAGGVVVPINTRFTGTEAAYVLGRSRARVLVTTTSFLGTDYVAALGAVDAPLPDLAHRIVVSGPDAPGAISWAELLAAAATVEPLAVRQRADGVNPDDPSDILFTSGTTGHPKGVVTTHHQTLQVFWDWSDVVGLTHGDRYLIVNPFFHTFGLKAGIVAALLRGATIVPEPVFDVPAVLARVDREQITMLPGPPTLYLSILDHPDRDRFDLRSLRLAVTGAAVVPVEMILRMREELTFRTIVTGYGLTESTGTVTMCRADDDAETIAHTCGRALPGTEVRVVDDTGEPQPPGEAGEVVTRGYHVMQGYLDDPAATAEAIDVDGWLHTGDVGVLDDQGYLRITDRKKDMFIVGGFNAYPAEIEQALAQHPAVGQVAVVGVPDRRMGEVGMAFVITRAGATVDPQELIAWSRGRLANYKVPRRVEVVDALPLNASGKVLKYELRARAGAARAVRRAPVRKRGRPPA